MLTWPSLAFLLDNSHLTSPFFVLYRRAVSSNNCLFPDKGSTHTSACPGAHIHGWMLCVTVGFNLYYAGDSHLLEEPEVCRHKSFTQFVPRPRRELCACYCCWRSTRTRGLLATQLMITDLYSYLLHLMIFLTLCSVLQLIKAKTWFFRPSNAIVIGPHQFNFSALGTGYMFSRAWHRLHVFPCLVLVTRFLPLSTGYMFSRAWYRWHLIPRLPQVTCFPALDTCCMFSRAWHQPQCMHGLPPSHQRHVFTCRFKFSLVYYAIWCIVFSHSLQFKSALIFENNFLPYTDSLQANSSLFALHCNVCILVDAVRGNSALLYHNARSNRSWRQGQIFLPSGVGWVI